MHHKWFVLTMILSSWWIRIHSGTMTLQRSRRVFFCRFRWIAVDETMEQKWPHGTASVLKVCCALLCDNPLFRGSICWSAWWKPRPCSEITSSCSCRHRWHSEVENDSAMLFSPCTYSVNICVVKFIKWLSNWDSTDRDEMVPVIPRWIWPQRECVNFAAFCSVGKWRALLYTLSWNAVLWGLWHRNHIFLSKTDFLVGWGDDNHPTVDMRFAQGCHALRWQSGLFVYIKPKQLQLQQISICLPSEDWVSLFERIAAAHGWPLCYEIGLAFICFHEVKHAKIVNWTVWRWRHGCDSAASLLLPFHQANSNNLLNGDVARYIFLCARHWMNEFLFRGFWSSEASLTNKNNSNNLDMKNITPKNIHTFIYNIYIYIIIICSFWIH